MVISKDPGCLE